MDSINGDKMENRQEHIDSIINMLHQVWSNNSDMELMELLYDITPNAGGFGPVLGRIKYLSDKELQENLNREITNFHL